MNLNNLMKLYDNDLFNDILLPDGIDHDTVVNTILSESALNTPMYPEHDLLKMMIQNFFKKYYNNFDRYNKALQEEYTPNENYHKTDERKINDNVNKHETLDGHQITTMDDHEVREDYKMAFDANDWRRTDRKDDKFYNSDDYKQWNNTDTKTNRDSNINTVSHGLSGTYSNQKLIDEELTLRTKYNIYVYISDLFYEEFMIKCM